MIPSFFFSDSHPLAFWSPGPAEMMVLAVVALLLYGGNLPEVARSWGKSFSEFRRGLTGFQSELNSVIYSEPEKIAYQDQNYRDESSYPDGYEESDPYQSEPEDSPGENDENEMTINDANADTIVFEGAEVDAAEETEEKPTD